MTKWRILHIPSGRYVTRTAVSYFSGDRDYEYGLGDYTKGEVYEAWFKWRAETKLENIFAGVSRPSSELLFFTDDNKCEFEIVKV